MFNSLFTTLRKFRVDQTRDDAGRFANEGQTASVPTAAGSVHSPEFQKWFAGSKVVDKDGEPLPVWHGTDAVFDKFDAGKQRGGDFGKGFYFASSKSRAKDFGGHVIEAYLSLQNPYIVRGDVVKPNGEIEWGKTPRDEIAELYPEAATVPKDEINSVLERHGHDGLIIGDNFIAFHPNQIKSVFNRKPTGDPDISKSWDESKHHRDNRGRFETEGWRWFSRNGKGRDDDGDHFVYRGTSTALFHEDSLKVEPTNKFPQTGRQRVAMFTPSPKDAKSFARLAVNEHGGQPLVMRIYKKHARKVDDGLYVVTKPTPIHSVAVFTRSGKPSDAMIVEKSWDESAHPREPKGSDTGGEFAPHALAPTEVVRGRQPVGATVTERDFNKEANGEKLLQGELKADATTSVDYVFRKESLDPSPAAQVLPSQVDMEHEMKAVRAAVYETKAFWSSKDKDAVFIRKHDGEMSEPRNVGNPVHANLILTLSHKSYGAGSGGMGSAKVFWGPYSATDRDARLTTPNGSKCAEALGTDPMFVLGHELHHAYGCGSELDQASDVTAVAAHLRTNLEFSVKAPSEWMHRACGAVAIRLYPQSANLMGRELRYLDRRYPEQLARLAVESHAVSSTEEWQQIRDRCYAIGKRKVAKSYDETPDFYIPSETKRKCCDISEASNRIATNFRASPPEEIRKRDASKLSASCVMAMLEPADAVDFLEFGSEIPDAEIYEKDGDFGREAQSHATCLYGLDKTVTLDEVRAITDRFEPFVIVCGRAKVFSSKPDYDCLVIPCWGSQLTKLNRRLKALPFENDYPRFQGHIAVAYCKKGQADKYGGDDRLNGRAIRIKNLMFSHPDHGKVVIPFGGVAKAYDPDEPRDAKGEWTSGGVSVSAVTTGPTSPREKWLAIRWEAFQKLRTAIGPTTQLENYGYESERPTLDATVAGAIQKAGISDFIKANPLKLLTVAKDWESLWETKLSDAGAVALHPSTMANVAGCHLTMKDKNGVPQGEVYLITDLEKDFKFGDGRLNMFDAKATVTAAKNRTQLIEISATHELTHQLQLKATPAAQALISETWEKYKACRDGYGRGTLYPVTKYAATNEKEWFAETHTAYVLWPEMLSAFDPFAYKQIGLIREALGLKG